MSNRTILDVSPGALTDYYDWLKQAAAGDVLVYWVGDLQHDRGIEIPETDLMRGADRLRINTLNVVADRIREDADDRQLALTQKRICENVFEYRATRRRQLYGTSFAAPKADLVLA
jgi:hypothetical protein